MNDFDAEELALHVLGLKDAEGDYDLDALDELMYEKFDVSMEQFQKIAGSLVQFTVPLQAGISGEWFRGFVTDGYFITKRPA